jgi:hypothetical protein
MGWLTDGITDWLKQLFIDAIMAGFSTMFGEVNYQVQDIARQVGATPESWNSRVFAMVKTLSETVVVPIAGMIVTFVLCYELIQLIVEKNNLSDFDTFNIFRWIFKTFVAAFILTNTFNIVIGVFELAQQAVSQSAGLISGSLDLGNDAVMSDILAKLDLMEVGELLGLFFEVQIVRLCMLIMSVIIMVIVWGRMLEIYLVVSLAPVPFSTFLNRDWGQVGNNYLKGLFALAFQGFLMMVCVAIYAVLVSGIAASDDIHSTIWKIAGMTALLSFILLKSGGISKSVFNAT